jgi:N-methylhydantoinase A
VASRFLGGEMPLDTEAARESIRVKIAEPLGMTVNEAAVGIVKIAIAEMSLAVRGVSVARGFDPRDFAMLAFGGAGPLHAAEIARELHIPKLIVPRVPGHFSALGMLMANLRHDYVRTYYKSLAASDFTEIGRVFDEMIAEGRQLLIDEGTIPEAIHVQRFLDLRYIGQEFPIQTPVSGEAVKAADLAGMRASFDELHDRRYGHQAVDEPIEIVNLRLTVTGRRERSHFARIASSGGDALIERSEVVLNDANAPVACAIYDREKLVAGAKVSGPAIIWEYASTTVLFDGDELTVADSGELLIDIGGQTV